MKTKLTITLIAAVVSVSANAQNIGDKLGFIVSQKEGGQVRMYSEGLTYEHYDHEGNSTWLYFFDKEQVCDKIAIHPETPRAEKDFVKFLDDNTDKFFQDIWSFKRNDGSILAVERKGELFVVTEVK